MLDTPNPHFYLGENSRHIQTNVTDKCNFATIHTLFDRAHEIVISFDQLHLSTLPKYSMHSYTVHRIRDVGVYFL